MLVLKKFRLNSFRVPPCSGFSVAPFILFLAIIFSLNGCATYKPKQLPSNPDLAPNVPKLTVDRSRFSLKTLKPRRFDAEDGLDMTAIATFAVINNPDLRALRTKQGIARAQLFSVGLLPDPKFSVKMTYPTDPQTHQNPVLVTGYEFGVNYNLNYFVTRRAAIDSAAKAVRQVDLDVIWQEWQAMQRSRILFARLISERRKLDILKQIRGLYDKRYSRSSRALQEGNLTLDVTGTDLTAKIDADTQVRDAELLVNKTHHELNALLGIWPEAQLKLVPSPLPSGLDRQGLDQSLAGLPNRRPDLMALKAGYDSQEAKVYEAVLGQFPSLDVGIVKARDDTNGHTVGHDTTISVPIFNGHRGKIAVEKATREQLLQEYQARIDQTHQQVDLLWTNQIMLRRQLNELQEHLPTLARMVEEARRAYAAQNMSSLTYINMENTLANKRLKVIDLIQALWESEITLDTLLANQVGSDQG
jgi:outer membrane protein TolC